MNDASKYDIPWELITDSFTGNLSPENEAEFNLWLSGSGNSEKYSRLRELWKNGLDDYRLYQSADESAAWKNLSAKMKSDETIGQEPLFKTGRNHFIRNLTGIAAGIVILIGIGYLFFPRSGNLTYKTVADEQRQIKLTDGSEIFLKPHTIIKLAQDFNKESRTILMEEGEAAFEVNHRDNPFIVKAGPVTVEDLGTSFIIRKGEEKIYVEVSSGKIAFTINATNETKELSAGTNITFNINEKRFGDIIDTKTGQISQKALLNFTNSPLSDVIVSIQKIYGNRIGIADTLIGQKRLTADFDGVPFENVLDIICKSLDLQYSLKDSTYVLTEKGKE